MNNKLAKKKKFKSFPCFYDKGRLGLIGLAVFLRLKRKNELDSWMAVLPVLQIQRKMGRMSKNHSEPNMCMKTYINIQLICMRI